MATPLSTTTRVTEGGRVVIPAEIRERLGIQVGEQVVISIEDEHVTITNLKAAIKRSQRTVAKYVKPGTSLSKELLEERRKEASRE